MGPPWGARLNGESASHHFSKHQDFLKMHFSQNVKYLHEKLRIRRWHAFCWIDRCKICPMEWLGALKTFKNSVKIDKMLKNHDFSKILTPKIDQKLKSVPGKTFFLMFS